MFSFLKPRKPAEPAPNLESNGVSRREALQRATLEELNAIRSDPLQGTVRSRGGVILDLDPAAEAIFGCASAKVRNQPLGSLCAERQAFELYVNQKPVAGWIKPLLTSGRRADGSHFRMRVEIRDKGIDGVYCLSVIDESLEEVLTNLLNELVLAPTGAELSAAQLREQELMLEAAKQQLRNARGIAFGRTTISVSATIVEPVALCSFNGHDLAAIEPIRRHMRELGMPTYSTRDPGCVGDWLAPWLTQLARGIHVVFFLSRHGLSTGQWRELDQIIWHRKLDRVIPFYLSPGRKIINRQWFGRRIPKELRECNPVDWSDYDYIWHVRLAQMLGLRSHEPPVRTEICSSG